MNVLEQYMIKRFENRMVTHLHKYFPEKSISLGSEGLLSVIRYGISWAKKYGIVIENDIGRYINLMFVFGKKFDMNPDLPWASKVLKDVYCSKSSDKMDMLYKKAEKHLDNADPIQKQENMSE